MRNEINQRANHDTAVTFFCALVFTIAVGVILALPACPAELSEQKVTWQRYWADHPVQQKLTKPIRWAWSHTYADKVWNVTGRPAFQTCCALGEASRQSGFTSFLGLCGNGGQVASTAILGAKRF